MGSINTRRLRCAPAWPLLRWIGEQCSEALAIQPGTNLPVSAASTPPPGMPERLLSPAPWDSRYCPQQPGTAGMTRVHGFRVTPALGTSPLVFDCHNSLNDPNVYTFGCGWEYHEVVCLLFCIF